MSTKAKPKSKSKSLKPVTAAQPSTSNRGVKMGRPKKQKPPTVHIRTAPSKDAGTCCGGSSSPIWNRSGDKPLVSVGPQQANKGTCGRCVRVYAARQRDGAMA